MALFRRNQQETIVDPAAPGMPPELTDYYKSERRERMLRSILMLFVTLAVTVLIIFAIFLGGRWAYKRFVKKSPNNTPTINLTQPSTSDKNNNVPAVNNADNNGKVTVSNGSTPSTTATTNNTTTTSTTNNTQSSTSTPSGSTTTTNNSSLTNTGPGDVAAVFALASIAGAAGYNLVASRRKD